MNLEQAYRSQAASDKPVDAPLSPLPSAESSSCTEAQQKIIDVAQSYFDADMQTPDDALLEFAGDRKHKDAVYFFTKGQWWSPKFGVLEA